MREELRRVANGSSQGLTDVLHQKTSTTIIHQTNTLQIAGPPNGNSQNKENHSKDGKKFKRSASDSNLSHM